MFGHIFAVFLSLFDALCQKVFNLAVDGAEVVFRPGCQSIVQIFGKTERNLFLFVICHVLDNHAPFPGTADAASFRNRGRQ